VKSGSVEPFYGFFPDAFLLQGNLPGFKEKGDFRGSQRRLSKL
jgi:hypothetical protein